MSQITLFFELIKDTFALVYKACGPVGTVIICLFAFFCIKWVTLFILGALCDPYGDYKEHQQSNDA